MLISASEIIHKSVLLYKNHTKKYLTYIFLIFIPSMVIFFGSLISINFLLNLTPNANPFIYFIIYLSIFLLMSLITVWITLALTRVIAKHYTNQNDEPVLKELKSTTPLLLAGIVAPFIAGLAVVGGLLLFIIPSFIFFVWFSFTFYAVAIDKQKIIQSLKTSKQLVDGKWWAVLWRLIAPAAAFLFIVIILQGLIQFVSQTIIYGVPNPSVDVVVFIISSILTTIVSLLVLPLTTASQVILYLELKHQKSQELKNNRSM